MVLSGAIPNRPILKRVLITCDWDECGRQAIRLYPRRASVRSKLSPFHFCSTRCQRLHWRERKRAEAELAAQATPRFCPACGGEILRTLAVGRPRVYCNDACRAKAARERLKRNPAGAVAAARARAVHLTQLAKEAAKAAKSWRLKYATRMADYDEAVAMVAASQHTDNPKELKDGVRETHDNLLEEQRRLDALAADSALHATSARSDWRKKKKVYARRAETARIRRARKHAGMAQVQTAV